MSDFHELMYQPTIWITLSIHQSTKTIGFLEETDSDMKSLKSIPESKSESEEDFSLTINSSSCPNLPSMIEHCNPLRIKEEEIKINWVSISDFMLVKALSHGAYGKVCIALWKKTRDIFAIKIIDKKKIEQDE